MKFWQLASIMRGEYAKVRRLARQKSEWRFVMEWIDNLAHITTVQDRAKLDFVLPPDFIRAALRKSRVRFYLSKDQYLRSRRRSFWDKSLSALSAFDRFGGDAMEEALERGSYSVAEISN